MATKAPAIDKYDSKRIRVGIRRVLMEIWDPIGVKDSPDAQDEYDGYLGSMYELLVGGSSDVEIKQHLNCIATVRMGFSSSPESVEERTVRALRNIPLPHVQD